MLAKIFIQVDKANSKLPYKIADMRERRERDSCSLSHKQFQHISTSKSETKQKTKPKDSLFYPKVEITFINVCIKSQLINNLHKSTKFCHKITQYATIPYLVLKELLND